MRVRNLVLIGSLIFFSGCFNIDPDKVTAYVGKQIENAKAEMNSEYAKGKVSFDKKCQAALQTTLDTLLRKELRCFQTAMNEALNYTDSLKTEMSKLKDDAAGSDVLIKRIFITEGKADSLFNKLRSAYRTAEQIARAKDLKIEVKKSGDNALGEPDVNERKNMFFAMNSPLGVQIILYGYQSELLKTGMDCLDGYCPSQN